MTPLADILILALIAIPFYLLLTNKTRKERRKREVYQKMIEVDDYNSDQGELFREYITYHTPTVDDLEKLKHTVRKYCAEAGKYRTTLLDRIDTYSKQVKNRNILDTAYSEMSQDSEVPKNDNRAFIVCTSCDRPTPSKGKFCGTCGAPLTEQKTS